MTENTKPSAIDPPEKRARYPHFTPIPTRWRDNDVYGHVNNVVYSRSRRVARVVERPSLPRTERAASPESHPDAILERWYARPAPRSGAREDPKMKNGLIATTIAGLVTAAMAAAGCSSSTSPSGSSTSSGCINESSENTSTPGTSPIYGACGSACVCGTPSAPDTAAQTAACATPCAPYAEPGSQTTGPIGTCLSFDATTFYCSMVCTTSSQCPAGGTCAFGPGHEVAGIILDTKMYCVKS